MKTFLISDEHLPQLVNKQQTNNITESNKRPATCKTFARARKRKKQQPIMNLVNFQIADLHR